MVFYAIKTPRFSVMNITENRGLYVTGKRFAFRLLL